jgi:transcriptional regulator GlxA family with amidase domain
MDKRIETVIELMQVDLHRVLSLRIMARSVNLSTSRFCYLFNTEIEMPPARYLRIVRMQAAKHLLETTFLSVKEIGALAGFNDGSHFVRNFKRLYGVTPSEHRGRTARSFHCGKDPAPAPCGTGSMAKKQ